MTTTFGPPPRRSNRGQGGDRQPLHLDTAADLRARPGEWAVITTRTTQRRAATYAYSVRNGVLHAYRPAGAYEAVSRTVGAEFRVYARFVGTPAGGEQA